jgi:coenzyme F420-0:L-glutamate ligase/coenzyme F420-1:gamma-L-glutamate ligase
MKSNQNGISIIPIIGIPEINPGDNITEIISHTISKKKIPIMNGDILVIAQKIISKSEDRIIDIDDVSPSPFAISLGKNIEKDPRIVEIILKETKQIVKISARGSGKGKLIVENNIGIICANAGVDASNVSGGNKLTLLPEEPDRSAKKIVEEFKGNLGVEIAVVISDTVGRPWRMGLTEIAIGCYGLKPLLDYRGRRDSKGYLLSATVIAIADEIACAAGLVMDKLKSIPAVIVRGYSYEPGGQGAKELIRSPEEDLFR